MTRTLFTAALLAALAAPAALAQTDVTTNTYDSSSTAADMALSCAEVSVAGDGTLSAKCNALNDQTGEVTVVQTTFDMRGATDCTASTGSDYSIVWSTSGTFDGSFANPTIVLSSTGQSYIAQGECDPTDGDPSPTSTLDVSDTGDGLRNNSGTLEKR